MNRIDDGNRCTLREMTGEQLARFERERYEDLSNGSGAWLINQNSGRIAEALGELYWLIDGDYPMALTVELRMESVEKILRALRKTISENP